MKSLLVAAALLVCTVPADAVEVADWQACAGIHHDQARLACYDRLVQRSLPAADNPQAHHAEQTLASLAGGITAPTSPSFADPAEHAAVSTSRMQARWELTADSDRGTFGLRPHQQNFAILKLTSNGNEHPFSPLFEQADVDAQALDKHEVQFQLSFKTKLLDDVLRSNSDLWLGYTQQSNWQIFNGSVSRPFRETNYQPELMWVAPITPRLGPLHFRYVSAGIVHQSNGRADPLSRSWDRLFVEVGAEAGNLALTFRPWWRIVEDASRDDNPDIERYIGRGELVASYRHEQHQFGLQIRNNFSLKNNRGSVLADWSFPLAGELRGYARLFSGYGESLIDYNWRQTTFGIGIILTDRL
jgi:phospholipase A1